jgi:hypothetical protein
VEGHGFSRADAIQALTRALAPEAATDAAIHEVCHHRHLLHSNHFFTFVRRRQFQIGNLLSPGFSLSLSPSFCGAQSE